MLKYGGRPAVIEAVSLEELTKTLQVNRSMATALFYVERRLHTLMRRFNYTVPTVAVRELSRRSLRRYDKF